MSASARPPASSRGSSTLSEHESSRIAAELGIPVPATRRVESPTAAAAAAAEIGFPVVLKLCGDAIAHKTERRLLRLGLADAAAVEAAGAELLREARPEDGAVSLLVAEQVRGQRELMAGLVRDPQFGPCVMLGVGGVLAEAIADVVFAAAPLTPAEAAALPGRLASQALLGPWRGESALDREALSAVLLGLSRLAVERPDIASLDLNPLILRDGVPVAVDALVELAAEPVSVSSVRPRLGEAQVLERFRPLFHPRGIAVLGASTHPAKFGFVALHNLLRFGYRGEVFAVGREGAEVLGRPTLGSVAELPDGAVDLAFVCTPASANLELLRACAAKGVRAAFVASAGYGEAGEEGRALERELVAAADALGVLLAGPNGQGVVSTPASMCAQIVAPYPPPGRISVASQSGNLVSSFLNYAVESGVGVAKAVSCGNSAQTRLAHYLDYFAADPDTDVALAYLESAADGAQLIDSLRAFSARKPLVLVKGGAAHEGRRAAASHTGALAGDDRVFDGLCHQLGVLRAPSVEEAFDWAASFATQPLPRGRRVVVLTTAGGWGVLAADACAAAGLDLIELPEELRERIDGLVPSRWSRGNPIDLAGGETRDTIPEVMDLVCAHPDVDAVIHLGLGIQANSAQVLRSGAFYPEHGLERIVAFHERQDRRYAEAARVASERHGVPVLCASELVHTDRHYGNAGPRGVREGGRLCYVSAHRAVSALRAMVDYAEYRAQLES